jgi:hypothetical protein
VDWEEEVTCPAGKKSISWLPNTYPQSGMAFEARFARTDCTPCPLRPQCTRSNQEPRIIGLLPREQHEALRAAPRRQETEEFRYFLPVALGPAWLTDLSGKHPRSGREPDQWTNRAQGPSLQPRPGDGSGTQ